MESWINHFSFIIILDIFLVTVLIYRIFSLLKGTRSIHALFGIVLLFVLFVIANVFHMETLSWVINKFSSSLLLVLVVLFQEEIRRFLTNLGKSFFLTLNDSDSEENTIRDITAAVRSLSFERTGALIAIERKIGLDKMIALHSQPIGALVSEPLLYTIFQKNSPLHDGAAIIRRNQIVCCSVHLPLTKNLKSGQNLGTRHSAAIGLTEECDAVVVVVSEETGTISVAYEGNLYKQSSASALNSVLKKLLLAPVTPIKSYRANLFKRINHYLVSITGHEEAKKILKQPERRTSRKGKRFVLKPLESHHKTVFSKSNKTSSHSLSTFPLAMDDDFPYASNYKRKHFLDSEGQDEKYNQI